MSSKLKLAQQTGLNLLASHALKTLTFCLLAIYSSGVWSLDFQSNEPIEIASDSAEIDDTTGMAVYKGNVEVTQGLAKLWANLVIVSAPEKVLTKISAEGSPSRFEQTIQQQDKITNTSGNATSIVYDSQAATITFEGDAKVEQDTNSFEGNLIVYDLKERAIRAKSDPAQDSRVIIRYLPTQKETAESSTAESIDTPTIDEKSNTDGTPLNDQENITEEALKNEDT